MKLIVTFIFRLIHSPTFFTLALAVFVASFQLEAQTLPTGLKFHPLQFQTNNLAAINPVTTTNISSDTNLISLNAWLRQKLASKSATSNHQAKLVTPAQTSIATTNDQEEYWFRANGTPSLIKVKSNLRHPNALTKLDEAARDGKVRDFIKNREKNFKIKDADAEFQINHRKQDAAGRYHYRLQQVFHGIKIWGGEAIVHLESDGAVGSMDAAIIPSPSGIATNPVVVLSNAVAAVNQKYYAGKGKILDQGELVIDGEINRQPRLAWLFSAGSNLTDPRRFLVDAINGEIINSVALVENGAMTGSGVDALGYTVNLNLWQNGGKYYMVDTTKPMYAITSAPPVYSTSKGTITIADFGHSQDWSTANYATSPSPSSGWIPDAVSASYDLSKVYDYYHSQFGRNSYDDAGSSLLGGVRYGTGFPNAFWSKQQNAMSYGDGYSAALDICGHEVTHGVLFSIGDGGILEYQNQPGALNEALADIFGECVEARAIGNNDWVMGTHLASGALRNLADPSSMIIAGNRHYPSKMSEFIQPNDSFLNNYQDQDNGGVHMNSLIFSHCFYLLAQGLNGALGLTDAEKIFYRAMTLHMLKQTQFIDARHACVGSAEELFGVGSTQALKTAEAFDKVEIFDTPPTAPPSTIPTVQAPDSTLCLRLDNNGYYSLYRKESAMGDSSTGSFIGTIHYLDAKRVSVSGNGLDVVFTTVDNDFGYVGTDGTGAELAGNPGFYHSAALSPDGSRIALVLLNQYTGNPENQIKIIDLNNNVNQTFTLYGQTSEGNYLDIVDHADVMDFTADGRYLIYDAYCYSATASGDILAGWTIFALDTTTGAIQTLVDLNSDYDIGNPALGNTHQNLITFDALNKTTGNSTVISYNVNNGDAGAIANVVGMGVPSYTGDDTAIIYSHEDSTVTSLFSLARQNLAADGIAPTGSATWYLKDADYCTIYRRGTFNPNNSAPQATLSAPIPGQIFATPTNILIQASAYDSDGSIAKVVFYLDSDPVATNKVTPYAILLSGVPLGQHRITARAFDNLGASVDTTNTVIYVVAPPNIVTQPQSRKVLVGTNVVLSVGVSGSQPIFYQWRKDGVDLIGATNSSFSIINATTNDTGMYSVTISNLARSVVSSSASLTVIAPPSITEPPLSQMVVAGTSATLSVTVSGTAPFTYQWLKNNAAIAKATNASLTFTNIPTTASGVYAVTIANAGSKITSPPATLTVYIVTNQLTVITNGRGTVSPNYNNAWLQVWKSYSLTAKPATGFGFVNWTDGLGNQLTNGATLKFVMESNLSVTANFKDIAKPTLTITNPAKTGLKWSNSVVFTVAGKCGDNVAVSNVMVSLNGADWQAATLSGTHSNWMQQVTLVPGTNLLAAFAVDATGNRSLTNTTKLIYIPDTRILFGTWNLIQYQTPAQVAVDSGNNLASGGNFSVTTGTMTLFTNGTLAGQLGDVFDGTFVDNSNGLISASIVSGGNTNSFTFQVNTSKSTMTEVDSLIDSTDNQQEMVFAQRIPTSLKPTDVAGTWYLSQLKTPTVIYFDTNSVFQGGDNFGETNGTLTLNANGTFSANLSGSVSGSFTVASNGVVTLNPSNGDGPITLFCNFTKDTMIETSSLFGPNDNQQEIVVGHRAPATLTAGALAGTWNLTQFQTPAQIYFDTNAVFQGGMSFNVGTGTMTLNANGTLSGQLGDTFTGTFTVSSGGLVKAIINGQAFSFRVNSSRDTMTEVDSFFNFTDNQQDITIAHKVPVN